jgi:hypothetical protein
MIRPLLLAASAAVLLTACETPQDQAVRAAAKQVAATRLLGPDDLQLVSPDGSIAIEVIGDTVHMMTPNAKVTVPATKLENVKYANGQLTFDIAGVGAQMFDVGNGAKGVAFTSEEALAFVATILDRQNHLERSK